MSLLARFFLSHPPEPTRLAAHLSLEPLEAREVPALTIQLDFSRDATGFFSDPARRAILQQAANDLAAPLDGPLAAVVPGAGNTWSETFTDPSTGQRVTLSNPSVAANTIVVYVGARDLSGSEAGQGGGGGLSASGSSAWLSLVQTRGHAGYSPWGGSLAFDTTTNWYFGASAAGVGATQVDFYSVAMHELGHVLGLGTAPQWSALVSGGAFTGANAVAVYGGPVPLNGDGQHWANGLTVGGRTASMDPSLATGTRVTFTSLDYAALADLGWSASGAGGGSTGAAPATGGGGTATTRFAAFAMSSPGTPVVLSGDGTARAYTLGADGLLASDGSVLTPFPGYTGTVRSTVADFDGDGIADFAFGTGSGTSATVRIVSGATGTDLVPPTTVLDGFSGGVFLAAGDVDRDGKAELAVSADAGGGNRISLFRVEPGALARVVDFMAFGDANFRGGSRVAMGDVNGDGAADLIVGAGVGGGPRIAIYDGAALLTGHATKLVPDFFALDSSLRSGVFVTAADFDGDGKADIAYSTGSTGGPRVRVVGGATIMANPGGDMAAAPALADFFALDEGDRQGIRITAHDLDGDGRAELVVGSGSKVSPAVRVIPLADMHTGSDGDSPVQYPFGDSVAGDGLYLG